MAFGSGRPVAERAVRPKVVVFLPPPLREDLGLGERVEELAVQELVAQLAVEALPWSRTRRAVDASS
jgi:hypothetical protein